MEQIEGRMGREKVDINSFKNNNPEVGTTFLMGTNLKQQNKKDTERANLCSRLHSQQVVKPGFECGQAGTGVSDLNPFALLALTLRYI